MYKTVHTNLVPAIHFSPVPTLECFPNVWEVGFITIRLSNTYSSFQNTTYRKTHLSNSRMDFTKRLSNVNLIFLMNIKYQWDFIIRKTCVQVSGFRDLVTADGKPRRAETVVNIVVYVESRKCFEDVTYLQVSAGCRHVLLH